MAWSTPLTAVANTALNASQWNASVRDNLNVTAVGQATTAGRWFIATGTTALAERAITSAEVLTLQTTTTTGSYLNLTTDGPIVSTVQTGTQAIVMITARMEHSVANGQTWASYDVSGATTSASSDNRSLTSEGVAAGHLRATATNLHTGLTAGGGGNTFHMQYKIATAGTGTFEYRKIIVMAL
jgi:hypothetical protein